MLKKLLALLCVCLLIPIGGSAVAESKLTVIATIFPQYDFVRAIAGDTGAVSLTMLLKPGAEAHTYEPTPQDIIAIRNADLFIYVGGESDAWVTDILASMPDSHLTSLRLMDMVPTVEEETVEGMQAENGQATASGATDAPELDEHVWTSPVNAIAMVNALCTAMSGLDAEHAEAFRANADAYIAKLQALDTAFRNVVNTAKRKEFIFGDRFAMRYFAAEYGLQYYAAFPGCSSETEPSAQTVAFLIDKVRADGVPVVLYPELSNHQVADAISAETGVPTHIFYACHNLTADEFAAGKTVVDFMTANLETLKTALN
ncbi:MAG TPA: metal ABC transporter substrate-binding protein [Candidatus Limiplasma sp.]|nr:metal ABC transporter substrate-binding protein [Candidatus Limiplasma sp.]HPS82460.1 metal ABC transporter substrate-binding protein [Candidatus Limiplasma sp.]